MRRSRKPAAAAPPKWIAPGALVHYAPGSVGEIKDGPWLEGGAWFVRIRFIPGFWPVSGLYCSPCDGRGQIARHRHTLQTTTVKTVRCRQCRGVGATKGPLDLRDVIGGGSSGGAR